MVSWEHPDPTSYPYGITGIQVNYVKENMCCWWPYLTIIQLYEEKPQEESEPSEEDQPDEMRKRYLPEEEILAREMLDIFGPAGRIDGEFVQPPMSTSNVRIYLMLSPFYLSLPLTANLANFYTLIYPFSFPRWSMWWFFFYLEPERGDEAAASKILFPAYQSDLEQDEASAPNFFRSWSENGFIRDSTYSDDPILWKFSVAAKRSTVSQESTTCRHPYNIIWPFLSFYYQPRSDIV